MRCSVESVKRANEIDKMSKELLKDDVFIRESAEIIVNKHMDHIDIEDEYYKLLKRRG